jgi:hypothetical protein
MLGINPYRSIEGNNKEVFLFAIHKPCIGHSTYLPNEMVRLHEIARLCPFVEGSAVYKARAILHAFEPDSAYYNSCEFAKKPDRESSERFPQEQEFIKQEKGMNKISDYRLIPNPNNGLFSLFCPDDSIITLSVYDSKGRNLFEQIDSPNHAIITINMSNFSNGIYNLIITSGKNRHNLKFVISK